MTLHEYGTTDLTASQLTESDLARLKMLTAQGKMTVTPSGSGWRVTVGATVGILPLDRIRLVIRPKFAISGTRLIDWLCYALAVPVQHHTSLRNWTTSPTGFTDLVAAALLRECQTLLRTGLRQDYVRRRSIEPMLRGRLDIQRQATHRYGLVDRLHVETFDRENDIWENQVCGAALAAAVALAGDHTLARALAETASEFPQVSPPTAVRALARAQYTRLNSRYRNAHTWARLLLTSGGVDDLLAEQGKQRAGTLLLDMPALWEKVVRRLFEEAAASLDGYVVRSSGARAISTTGDLQGRRTFRPDVLLRFPKSGLMPVDAKYKKYGSKNIGADDVHQLLTYMTGYSSSVVLAHPSPDGASFRTLRTCGPYGALGNIEVVGVDTTTTPEKSLPHLQKVCANATTRPG
ncbi:5-methylcytosine restriction system specificity protein McrC [Saccharopolyspora sp. SCSIO 74807]|uniref:McrC family protein n=1 Tax=Saccharopolyspora sp. SCSIO 74807 TaxID=3118084 RepID=UPI0030CA6808